MKASRGRPQRAAAPVEAPHTRGTWHTRPPKDDLGSPTSRQPALGARAADHTREQMGRALDASTSMGAWTAVTWIVVGIVGCWLLTFWSGGTHTAVPHTFYVPVILAASRFRWRGAVVTAVVAGIAVGPFMKISIADGTVQPTAQWVGRLIAFLVIGVVVAWLTHESSRSIVTYVRDTRSGRELRHALERGDLRPHYQPIVDLTTGRVIGFEALCRWTTPAGESIPPSTFIPVAERTGAVIELGAVMLDRACRQAAAWNADSEHDLTIAVNVSATQLCHPDLVRHVSAALDGSGLDPARLCLEITESAILHDPVTALAQVDRLHSTGVQISLDDFGTGQSSLAYLQHFPIDVVKIDQSFVKAVDLDERCSLLVAAIIQLAHTLGATLVAEGIERQGQQDALLALGCDHGQGYHLGRPAAPPVVGLPVLEVPLTAGPTRRPTTTTRA